MSDQPKKPSLDPAQFSQLLLAQIEQRMLESLAGTEQQPTYCVIRSRSTHVLSVLAASTLGHDHDMVWGPKPFAECIAYVNAEMLLQQAQGDKPAHHPPEEPQ